MKAVIYALTLSWSRIRATSSAYLLAILGHKRLYGLTLASTSHADPHTRSLNVSWKRRLSWEGVFDIRYKIVISGRAQSGLAELLVTVFILRSLVDCFNERDFQEESVHQSERNSAVTNRVLTDPGV
jgi:hypothetical protein